MDQLKTHLAVVAKYGFWITSALVFLGSLGVWYMTTSQLAQEAASQTSKINGAIGTVQSVSSELPTLPNDHSHTEMERLIADRQNEVLKSWQMLYDRQRDILKWPVNELKQDFVKEFEPLIPIEIAVNFPTDPFDEKETTLLSRYEDYIEKVLPGIAEIAKTEWTAEFGPSAGMMGGMMGGDMGMEMGMGGYGGGQPTSRTSVDITGAQQGPLVQWDTGSQSQLLKDLFPWGGRRPTTLEVLYSQENLWILRQLLQIIDDVNGDARQPYQAKIHQIKRIGIGKSVRFGAGNISKPGAAAMGMGGMDMEMEMMGGMGGMDMEMEMDMDSMSGMGGFGGGSTSDPGDNRYVNASFEPITGAALRSALTSNSPSDASLAVAKRIPVMMSLNMDQRAVHELLAVCGSADLMVEVQQVRVLPKSATGGGGGMGGMMGMEDDGMDDMMGGGMGGMGMGMGMGGGGGGGGGAGMEKVDEFPLDMSVEIYGIIYIYNKPDPAKFGVEQVTEDTVIDGATETIGGTPVAPAAPVDSELPTPAPAPDEAAPTPPAATDPSAAAPPTAMVPVVQP